MILVPNSDALNRQDALADVPLRLEINHRQEDTLSLRHVLA